jgi:hypothetical protein
MVRYYKRTSNRGAYSSDNVVKALQAIRDGMSKNKAATLFGVPRTTINRRLRNAADPPSSLGRFKPVFSHDFENELLMHVVEMQQRFYGLSLHEFRSIAYELAARNGLHHPFSNKCKIAGVDWARQFMTRYPELTLRKPEATSMSRLSGFNRVQVGRFFDHLESQLKKTNFAADQVYNIDETGITTVQTPGKILARKGAKQVGRVVSAERGSTTTVVCAMSASGNFVPPMFLFKRKTMNNQLMRDCPAGSVGIPSPSGWMDTTIFVTYLHHFIRHAKPTAARPILVLLDGHHSHKSLDAIQLARQNHVHMLTIPPHTSHKLQPLDLTFFGPLKTSYNRQVDKWMLAHAGQRVSDYDIAGIFTRAYERVAVIEKATKGFACAGIVPYNPEVFGDEEFAPATVTEQSDPAVNVSTSVTTITASQVESGPETSNCVPTRANKRKNQFSRNSNATTPAKKSKSDLPTPGRISVTDISPYPHAKSTGSRKRRAEVSTVITDSPYKTFLENKLRPAARKLTLNQQPASSSSMMPAAKKTSRNRKVGLQQPESSSSSSMMPAAKKTSRNRTVGLFPKPLHDRKPLPRQPVWLQKSSKSGRVLLQFCCISIAGPV